MPKLTPADVPKEEEGEQEIDDWKTTLLDRLREIDPHKFEELCGELLRAENFTNVKVTQQSHDGGIDGTASLRVKLMSFDVAFQCKRHKGNVGIKDMQAFVGALTTSGVDKGLFITTSKYTKGAQRVALKNKVGLINGDALCDLMQEYKIGVMGVKMQIDESFFAELKKKS